MASLPNYSRMIKLTQITDYIALRVCIMHLRNLEIYLSMIKYGGIFLQMGLIKRST